jgi:hypothetical protein
MFSSDPNRPLFRIIAALVGLAIAGRGFISLSWRGNLHYANWFGGLVFAPFAVLLGLALILSALFKPEILGRPASRWKR